MTDAVARADAEIQDAGGRSTDAPEYMSWDSRARRTITIYIPLALFMLVLLFPFYWMAITTFKPNNELYNYTDHNPFWVTSPTLQNVEKLLFDTDYPQWLMTTMGVAEFRGNVAHCKGGRPIRSR